jgi:hypothetical protein
MDDIIDFQRGLTAGLQPRAAAREASGQAVTAIGSWWHHRRCTACGHSFRRGEQVRLGPGERDVRHLEPATDCDGAERDETPDTDVFTEALLAAWPAGPGVPVARLEPGHPLLDRKPGPYGRATCLFCAHTFRRGERVIVCPCQPDRRHCDAAVHRDPAMGLVCWESWRPSGRLQTCPVTLRRLEG